MADTFEVPELQASDSDDPWSSDSESDSEPVTKKGRGKAKRCISTTLCKTSKRSSSSRSGGTQRSGGHVSSREDTSAHVEQLRVEHNHTAAKTLDKISEELKARIKQLTVEGVKPKRIHTIFTKEGMDPIPSLKQIQYYVNNQRTPASQPFTDHQLRTYCEGHSAVPDDPNKMYVLAYEINGPDSFFVMWTTPRLLERQLDSEQLQADATSSTNWHNYPLLVLGHSDFNRHFVPTLLAIGKSENKYVYHSMFRALRELGYRPAEVLGDGADAITSATKEQFPGAKRIMCAVHAVRRVDVHSTKIPVHLRKRMREEVLLLQGARNDVEFERIAGMLLDVWRGEEDEQIGEFAKYFEDTWVTSDLCNWHEGTTSNCANTNGLESTNKRIKTDFLTRTMQAFEPFLQDVGAILNYWSVHLRDRPSVPDIPLAEMKKALELVSECTAQPGGTPRRYYLRLAGTATYVFASSESSFANVGELFEAYRRSFIDGPATWEEYAERRFEVHLVYPSTKFNGRFYECSCQKGCKNNVCKHAVMVMCTLEKIYEYSAEALAKTMKHSRRSNAKQIGRPALSQKQNRFAAAD